MDPLFEKLNSVSTMVDAERELAAMGTAAVVRLTALFEGSSCNQWGIPYRNLGLPLQCALEVAARLGPIAKPLESYIAAELPHSEAAARALGALDKLDSSSLSALALALDADLNVAGECARVLVQQGEDRSPVVKQVERSSATAQKHLEAARRQSPRTGE